MKTRFCLPLSFAACLTTSLFYSLAASAQVTSDGTTGTVVNNNGNSFEIDAGTRSGDNLFHSFGEFSIPTGGSAVFNNDLDVSNILSRVTGGNISQINGLIRSRGGANLFLINPAGIIFGAGAGLNIGGSFYGSTADSILFKDGEFSAVDNLNQPILTINAPIGLNLRDNPAGIINQSISQNSIGELVGLEVIAGKTISLVGGNIAFKAGEVTAKGGNVELGGLADSGIVNIEPDGSLTFPESISRANIFFTNVADVDATATGGGSITVNANNIELLGNSALRTGISTDSTSIDAQAGDINIEATGIVDIRESRISNIVNAGGIGNAGDININAASLSLSGNSTLISSTLGTGNAGDIIVNATEEVSLYIGDIFSNVGNGNITQARGNAGEIRINANSISLLSGAQIQSGVFENNFGNGNNVTLDARSGDVTISGGNQRTSGIYTDVEAVETVEIDTNYQAGNININAQQGSIRLNNAVIKNTNQRTGFAGDIKLNAPNEISIKDSEIIAEGDFGRIFIGDSIQPSRVILEGERTLTQNGLQFNYSNLLSTNNSNVDDTTGDIRIIARDSIDVLGSNIQSQTETTKTDFNDQEGRNFSTVRLKVAEDNPRGRITINQSRIGTSNFSTGYAGDVVLNAGEKIEILDTSIFSRGRRGRVLIGKSDLSNENSSPQEITFNNSLLETSNTSVDAEFSDQPINAGNISINGINNISFVDSIIKAVTERLGNAGNLTVQSENGSVSLEKSIVFNNVNPGGIGNAGGVNITANNSISFTNGAELQSGTVANKINDGFDDSIPSGQGNGGDITLNAKESITLSDDNPGDIQDGSGIFADVENTAIGDGGNIIIDTDVLSLDDKAIITAQNVGQGNGGDITLNISDRLTLAENSTISTQVVGTNASGGNITINAQDGFIVAPDSQNLGSGNDIVTNSPEGRGGNIRIEAQGVLGIQERDANDGNGTNDIDASGTVDGDININAPSSDAIEGATKLPGNPVEAGETVAQACISNRGTDGNNLVITGRGGMPNEIIAPLVSDSITVNGQATSAASPVKEIKTSKGNVIAAQGIEIKGDGTIVLTAYPTSNNSRIPHLPNSCGKS